MQQCSGAVVQRCSGAGGCSGGPFPNLIQGSRRRLGSPAGYSVEAAEGLTLGWGMGDDPDSGPEGKGHPGLLSWPVFKFGMSSPLHGPFPPSGSKYLTGLVSMPSCVCVCVRARLCVCI